MTEPTLPKSIVNALPTSAVVMEHLHAIAKLAPKLEKELIKAEKAGAIPLARAFVAMHRLIKRSEELLKPINDTFNVYKSEKCPALFDQSGVTSIPLDEGFRVGISARFVASIVPGKKDAAFDWLRKNELGDLIQETVNAGTLSAAGKVLRDDKNIELPEEIFRSGDVPNTSVTATKAK